MAVIDGGALRTLREKDGYTAKEFAAKAHISLQYLCDIEAGRRGLSRRPDLVKRFAELLNIPLSMIERRVAEEAS